MAATMGKNVAIEHLILDLGSFISKVRLRGRGKLEAHLNFLFWENLNTSPGNYSRDVKLE